MWMGEFKMSNYDNFSSTDFPATNYGRGYGKITTSNGKLFKGGLPFKEIGINAHDLFIDMLAGGTNYINDLANIAAKGVKTIRVSAGPLTSALWTSQVGTSGTTPVSTYIPKLRLFLDTAQSNGIGVILSLFWKSDQLPLALTSTVVDYQNSGSTTRNYMKALATTLALNFSEHKALAAWEIGNEWFDFASIAQFATVATNTGVDHFAALVGTINDIVSGIRAWDIDRSIISPSGTNGRYEGGELNKLIRKYIYAAGNCDIVSLHLYPDTDISNYPHSHVGEDLGGAEIFIRALRVACYNAGKVLAILECGGEVDDASYGAAVIGSVTEKSFNHALATGVEFIAVWGWYANLTGTGTQIAPDIKSGPRSVPVFNLIKKYQPNFIGDENFIAPSVGIKYSGKFKAPSKCARGNGTNANIKIPNHPDFSLDAVSTSSFWVMFWLRKNAVDYGTNRYVANDDGSKGFIITADNPIDEGMNVQIVFSGGYAGFTPSGFVYPANAAANPTRSLPGEWHHFAFQFDGSVNSNAWGNNSQNATWWKDGCLQYRVATTGKVSAGQTSRDLYLLSRSDGLGQFVKADIADFITGKNSLLSSKQVSDYFLYGKIPDSAKHRYELNGSCVDSIGTNHGTPNNISWVPTGLDKSVL